MCPKLFQRWGGSCRGGVRGGLGVGHSGLGWVKMGSGGSCRGGVGHEGVGWGGSCSCGGVNTLLVNMQPYGCFNFRKNRPNLTTSICSKQVGIVFSKNDQNKIAINMKDTFLKQVANKCLLLYGPDNLTLANSYLPHNLHHS